MPEEEFLITQSALTLRNRGRGLQKNLVYDWEYEDNFFDYELKLEWLGRDIEIIEEEDERLTVNDNREKINTYYIHDDTNSYLISEAETQVAIPKVYIEKSLQFLQISEMILQKLQRLLCIFETDWIFDYSTAYIRTIICGISIF